MNVLVFKTDLKTTQKVDQIKPLLDNHPIINDWSVDIEDIDNVLRIEPLGVLDEQDVIKLAKTYGFQCEILPE